MALQRGQHTARTGRATMRPVPSGWQQPFLLFLSVAWLSYQPPAPSRPFLPIATAAGSLPCSSGVGSRSGYCPVTMSIIDLANWSGSLGRLGGQLFGIPRWTGNEPKSRHPSCVPILDGLATHGAFKAADFARLYHMFAAVIDRAAFTGSITRRF